MSNTISMAPAGYSSVPAGHVATVVTCLEMLEKPRVRQGELPAGVTLEVIDSTDMNRYRKLYRHVGEEWLWFSRIIMKDHKLAEILEDKNVVVYALQCDGKDIGILELDYRVAGECELAFFGLTSQATGKGLGRCLMDAAIFMVWNKPVSRFWVHTCTFDHPAALNFYIRSGFQPYAIQIEVAPDPRLTGYLPENAAPHIPLLKTGRG
ncbi:GNAT family N-acetyltransferase [Erwinia sp. SLM-02]|uniref:GNAT family N-acetyltransferase n=1 Tax=Erwinia sp. SLM-02 TaxID=3020057 RepID=UPI00308039F0